jgi:hypothetical protein
MLRARRVRRMMIKTPIRRVVMIATLVALCAIVTGCASDVTTPSGHQLRYYGGPKSPMWPG